MLPHAGWSYKTSRPSDEEVARLRSLREKRVELRTTPRKSGEKVPPDKLDQIFEPFVQLARGQTVDVVGTGLGLSISRDLARAMGAELTAESRLDEGSTFTLSLPRRRVAAD